MVVLGYDAIPEGLAKVRDGELAATVEQLPGQQVKNAVDALVAFLRDKKPLETLKLDPILIKKKQPESSGADQRSRIAN